MTSQMVHLQATFEGVLCHLTMKIQSGVGDICCYLLDLGNYCKLPLCRLIRWLKCRGGATQDDPQNLHRVILAFLSDFLMPSPIFVKFPELRRNRALTASLDHSIWFHAPVQVDKWHLFVQDCDRAVGENAITICRYEFIFTMPILDINIHSGQI